MRRLLVAVVAVLACCAAPAVGQQRHVWGCWSRACDVRVGRAWARAHPPRIVATRFDLCVANRENGEPGATSWGTINWRADNAYEGAFSWEPSKWAAGGGLRFARRAFDATPEQQLEVFHRNGARGEWTLSNWPTIAGCR